MIPTAKRSETAPPRILLADDDEGIRMVMRQAIEKQGFSVDCTGNGKELLEWVKEGRGDLVITDVMMPGLNGLDALTHIRSLRPELPVIVISAQSTLQTAVAAAQRGSQEYFPKPFDLHELLRCVESLLPKGRRGARGGVEAAAQESPANLLIGASAAMQPVYRAIARLAPVDLTVMLEGESGTGKEIIAHAIHGLSVRKDKPFVALNMAAIPRELVESELFGHERGAFTGAHTKRKGKFAQAQGGTLFLDEIGDMPLEAQAKLLRVLQENAYTPVGGTEPEAADVRIICATHQNLAELCKEGKFREDLYYRLYVVPVGIPPLRERPEDIPLLVEHFLSQAQARGLPTKRFDAAALNALKAHPWPGNVRELEHTIYRLCVLVTEPSIGAAALKKLLPTGMPVSTAKPDLGAGFKDMVAQMLETYFKSHAPSLPPAGVYERVLKEIEQPLIAQALAACGGNQIKAADLLGINRNTLRKKIRDLDIALVKTVTPKGE